MTPTSILIFIEICFNFKMKKCNTLLFANTSILEIRDLILISLDYKKLFTEL